MINAFRYSMLGVSDVNFLGSITMILILGSLFFLSALYLLSKGQGVRS
jgi:ABC-2 type transport system permease protein